jgi:hypothetical protein
MLPPSRFGSKAAALLVAAFLLVGTTARAEAPAAPPAAPQVHKTTIYNGVVPTVSYTVQGGSPHLQALAQTLQFTENEINLTGELQKLRLGIVANEQILDTVRTSQELGLGPISTPTSWYGPSDSALKSALIPGLAREATPAAAYGLINMWEQALTDVQAEQAKAAVVQGPASATADARPAIARDAFSNARSRRRARRRRLLACAAMRVGYASTGRRAGFAATWNEIQRDLKDGPGPSTARVLTGKAATDGVPGDFQTTSDLLGESAATSGDPARLKAWWVYRMLYGPDPLTERLALMWHNHFATSNEKVENLVAMRRQNQLFRTLGRGPFGNLLSAVVHDPALLVWLDAPSNRKGHPNENLARELMELFTLGIGHYGESDVKEAARALTGWDVDDDQFADVPARHDDGAKTILGRKGPWKGDDLVRMVLEHPATAWRLAWRICELFLGEKALKAADIDALASVLRKHNLEVGRGVETVLRSRLFFSDENIGNRVSGPVEFVVAAARSLELFDPPLSTLLLAEWCARLGQDLFYPPNVGGWPGGRSWLTTRAVIGRANYATALLEGQRVGRPPADVLALARRHGETDVVALATRLLMGADPRPGRPTEASEEDARRAVALVLSLPEAQLN